MPTDYSLYTLPSVEPEEALVPLDQPSLLFEPLPASVDMLCSFESSLLFTLFLLTIDRFRVTPPKQ